MWTANRVEKLLGESAAADSCGTTSEGNWFGSFIGVGASLLASGFLLALLVEPDELDSGFWSLLLFVWVGCFLVGLLTHHLADELEDTDWGVCLNFLCGNLIVHGKVLLRGPSLPKNPVPRLATPILMVLLHSSEKVIYEPTLYEILRQGKVKADQREFGRTLLWLLKENWVQGNERLGYRVNSRRFAS